MDCVSERDEEGHLNSRQSVEQVRVVRDVPAEASRGVPAVQYELHHFITIHVLGTTHDLHGGQAPIATWRQCD